MRVEKERGEREDRHTGDGLWLRERLTDLEGLVECLCLWLGLSNSSREGHSSALGLAARLAWTPADCRSSSIGVTLGLAAWLTWAPADGAGDGLGESIGDGLSSTTNLAAWLAGAPADWLGLGDGGRVDAEGE